MLLSQNHFSIDDLRGSVEMNGVKVEWKATGRRWGH